MIRKLITLLQAVVPSYDIIYEEARMMNIKADAISLTKGFIYIEEFRSGQYTEKYGISKTTKVNIYFCRFTEMHNDALQREDLRERIEAEAVLPFLREWRNAFPANNAQGAAQFSCPIPRFDANEVSICLTLNITEELC